MADPTTTMAEPIPWVYDDGGRRKAGFKGSANDCVVRAIAIATGEDYRVLYDEFNWLTKGRRSAGHTEGARTGITRKMYDPVIRSYGFEWTPTMGIGTGTTVHVRMGEVPSEGTHIFRLSRHLATIRDGVLYDTSDCSRHGTRAVYGIYSRKEF